MKLKTKHFRVRCHCVMHHKPQRQQRIQARKATIYPQQNPNIIKVEQHLTKTISAYRKSESRYMKHISLTKQETPEATCRD